MEDQQTDKCEGCGNGEAAQYTSDDVHVCADCYAVVPVTYPQYVVDNIQGARNDEQRGLLKSEAYNAERTILWLDERNTELLEEVARLRSTIADLEQRAVREETTFKCLKQANDQIRAFTGCDDLDEAIDKLEGTTLADLEQRAVLPESKLIAAGCQETGLLNRFEAMEIGLAYASDMREIGDIALADCDVNLNERAIGIAFTLEELARYASRCDCRNTFVSPSAGEAGIPEAQSNYDKIMAALKDVPFTFDLSNDTLLNDHGRRVVAGLQEELKKYVDRVAALEALAYEARDHVSVAIYGDDGLDISDGEPFIEQVSNTLGDKADYEAQQKCSDDPCERCGEDGIRHVRKVGPLKYEGLCDDCFAIPQSPSDTGSR